MLPAGVDSKTPQINFPAFDTVDGNANLRCLLVFWKSETSLIAIALITSPLTVVAVIRNGRIETGSARDNRLLGRRAILVHQETDTTTVYTEYRLTLGNIVMQDAQHEDSPRATTMSASSGRTPL